MKIGGGRTQSVFERYAIVSQTDVQEALEKLAGSRQSSKQKRATKESPGKQTCSIGQLRALRASVDVVSATDACCGKDVACEFDRVANLNHPVTYE
jgi:hypothetical protein